MALLDKGISVYNPTTGETQTINLYTTQEEVGTPYKEFAYNGEVVYVAITQDKDAAYATDFKFDNADGTWYVCTQPGGGGIAPTNGTLDIEGNLDLSEDFKVNGNVTVSGNVTGTGTLSATGTITVSGSTEATVNAGATLSECDISIDNGTTTFNSDTTVADGKVYVGGTGVTNAADCVVYCDMEIESSRYGVENSGAAVIVSEDATVNIAASTYGIYNRNNGIFTVSERATLDITASSRGIQNNLSTFTISGTITINGTGSTSYGIFTGGSGNYTSSAFTVSKNAIINITAGEYGIYLSHSGSYISTSNIISGTITINCTESTSYGIYTMNQGTVTVADGAVIAITANYGLRISSSFIVESGATINITAGEYGIFSYGITIDGIIVIITSGTGVNNHNYSMSGTGTITVNGEPYDF